MGLTGEGVTLGDAGLRTAIRRVAVGPAPVIHAAVAVPFALGVTVPPAIQYAPFLVSLLVFGLPHGAVDHLAPVRVRGDHAPTGLRGIVAATTRGTVLRVSVLYLVLGGAYLLAFAVVPTAAFGFFILLTWFHWGQGDAYAMAAFHAPTHLRTRAQRGLAVVVRGGLPMLVPLVGDPAGYREVVAAVVALFGRDVGPLAPVFRADVRLALGVAFAAVSAGALAVGYRRARDADAMAAWRADVVETVTLWGFFLVVPPLLAVGLYFCLWHSVRHIARLVALDPPAADAIAAGRLRPALTRFARDAAPMTAGALAVLVGVFAFVPASATVPDLIAVYLVVLAVLTLPHVVVVLVMDRHQALWTPAADVDRR